MSKLRDASGTVMTEEGVVAAIARAHCESLGRGEWEDGVDGEGSGYVGKGPDETAAAELDCAPTYEEVVKAIKGVKEGEGSWRG